MHPGESAPLPHARGPVRARPAFISYFGLRENPFRGTSDPRYLLLADQTRTALDGILRGIHSRAGLLVLTGEVGAGKTVLLNALLDLLRQRAMPRAFLFNSHLETNELIEMALAEFGAPRDLRTQLGPVARLQQWVLNSYRVNSNPVLIVDEAQGLKIEVLEALRMLLNLEASGEKLLQIVLAGQPEFDTKINMPELRQLRQRIAFRCRLRALTQEETFAYIEHRLRVAGGAVESVFERDAIVAVHHFARGTPRVINALCEQAMMKACAERCRPVAPKMIGEAAFESELDGSRQVGPPPEVGGLLTRTDASLPSKRAHAPVAIASAVTSAASESVRQGPLDPAGPIEPSILPAPSKRAEVMLAMSASAGQGFSPQRISQEPRVVVHVEPHPVLTGPKRDDSQLATAAPSAVAIATPRPSPEEPSRSASPAKNEVPQVQPAENAAVTYASRDQATVTLQPGAEEALGTIAHPAPTAVPAPSKGSDTVVAIPTSEAPGASAQSAPQDLSQPLPAAQPGNLPALPKRAETILGDLAPRPAAHDRVLPGLAPLAVGSPVVRKRRVPSATLPVTAPAPVRPQHATTSPSPFSSPAERNVRLSRPVSLSLIERLAANCLRWLREPMGSGRRRTSRKTR